MTRLRRSTAMLTVTAASGMLLGCGARLDESQWAELGSARGPTATTLAAGASGSAAAAQASAPVLAGTGAPAGAGTSSGANPSPDAEAASGAACVPQHVEEVGVTDTEIVLGNVSMISGPIPGAGQPGVYGTLAYLEYVNSLGGVCGRHLRLVTGDDRTDSGQSRSETLRLSREALGLVGGASVVDGGAAAALDGTNVPAAQVAVDDAALASPNIFSPSPIEPTGATLGSEPMWRYFQRSLGVQRVSVVVLAISSARARANTYVHDIERAGLEVSGFHEVALAESNFVSIAQQLENEGAQGFISLLDPVASARLAKAIQQIQWQPLVAHYGAQNYGQTFLELAGDAAEGTLIPLAFDIFEDAPTNPTVARFLEWFERVAPGRTPDFYAAMGWASADMMVQALEAAGPAPTRDAVLGWLHTLTSFDAHGFLAPCNPAGKVTSPYFLVAKVEGGRWHRVYPDAGFADGA